MIDSDTVTNTRRREATAIGDVTGAPPVEHINSHSDADGNYGNAPLRIRHFAPDTISVGYAERFRDGHPYWRVQTVAISGRLIRDDGDIGMGMLSRRFHGGIDDQELPQWAADFARRNTPDRHPEEP